MNKQEKIDEIMDSFDFEKVHKAMVALDWEWGDEGVPSTYSIKQEARRFLKFILEAPKEKEFYRVSGGGLEVERDCDQVTLRFQIDRQSVYLDE